MACNVKPFEWTVEQWYLYVHLAVVSVFNSTELTETFQQQSHFCNLSGASPPREYGSSRIALQKKAKVSKCIYTQCPQQRLLW